MPKLVHIKQFHDKGSGNLCEEVSGAYVPRLSNGYLSTYVLGLSNDTFTVSVDLNTNWCPTCKSLLDLVILKELDI